MSRDHGRSPHPAARASSVSCASKPWEGCADSPSVHSPADPQGADSTPCTGRAFEPDGLGPVLCDGRRGFRAGRAPRDEISLGRLPAGERRLVWEGIKQLEPALAELLRGDAGVQGLRSRFNAGPRLRMDEYRRFLEAGKAHTTAASQETN